jgi:hypothetical protein
VNLNEVERKNVEQMFATVGGFQRQNLVGTTLSMGYINVLNDLESSDCWLV